MLPTALAGSRDTGGDSTPDEDQGVIRCICDIDDDDGFTIQCENCLVWQHAVCVGVEQDNVPDEYLCEKCNPRKLDVKVRFGFLLAVKQAKACVEHACFGGGGVCKAVEYQKRRLDTEYKHAKETRKKQRYAPAKGRKAEEANERRKRGPDSKQARIKNSRAGGRESLSPTATRSLDRTGDSPGHADSNYTTIDRNILGADVQVLFHSVLGQLAEQRNVISNAAATVTANAPRELEIGAGTAASLTDAGSAEHEMTGGSGGAPHSDGTQTANGNSNNISERAPQSTGNQGSALPLPMVPISMAELARPSPTYRSEAGKDGTQIGLFTREAIKQQEFICEFRGQVLLKATYKEDPKNYYELLRTTRPYSHFHREIDLCVDARRQGSEARFARRSCDANVELRSMYIPESTDSCIYLGLFAAQDISADSELTLGWEWEDGELPGVASMAADDAEDYLARPEGRRMSKVWRQVFGGMSCACPNMACDVRRLFAMLGVEEQVQRTDSGSALKRRASRSTKSGVGASDDGAANGTVQVRSPDAVPLSHGARSPKSSAAGVGEGPASPMPFTGISSGHDDSSNGARDTLSVFVDHRRATHSASRQSSVDTYEGANGQVTAERYSNGSDTRKRKSSAESDGIGSNDKGAISVDPVSDCEGVGIKKQRALDGTATIRSSDIPQKKLWISQYLERTEPPADVRSEVRTAWKGENDSLAAERGSAANAKPIVAADVKVEPTLAEDVKTEHTVVDDVKPESTTAPNIEDTGRAAKTRVADETSAVSHTEARRARVRSAPTDANAPTPSPSPSPPPVVRSKAADETQQTPKAPTAQDAERASEPKEADTSSSIQDNQEARQQSPPSALEKAATAPAPAPAKKQRLSLEEYNKRRRGNTAGSGAKDGEVRGAVVETGPTEDSGAEPPAAATLNEPKKGHEPGSDDKPEPAEPSRTPPPRQPHHAQTPNGVQTALHPLAAPAPLRAADDVPNKRPVLSPPPPPPPPAAALAAAATAPYQPNGSLRGEHYHRFDRGPPPPPPPPPLPSSSSSSVQRVRDRDRALGGADRESGEIGHRRDFRVRSQSRERSGRDPRRYNTHGGAPGYQGHGQGYHQYHPTPQRGSVDRRPGGMRTMSMSPVQLPNGSARPPQAPSGENPHHHTTTPRRAGVGSGGSRGGSPTRR
ncbi:SET domain-containing protein 3 [Coemansia guatemalensis]|uniref:SET domain-containing protein 3 n=1 Tax=Coemansia guatemalensis TaxID=2761395 RepID=A0A9W8LQD0_9FUNG|nr:SET domain-containing protein 3 [Coemansia guatemalensis]